MATVRTEYINSSGNNYGTYLLLNNADLNVNPETGECKSNNLTINSVSQMAVFDTDANGIDNSLPFQILTTGVFNSNAYFFVVSNTNGLDPETGNQAEFIRYNLTSAGLDTNVLTIGLTLVDGEGSNIVYGDPVYLRLYSDIDDTSSVSLATTQSELSNFEAYTVIITTLG